MPSADVLMAQIAARVRGGTYDDDLEEIVNGINSISSAIKDRRKVLGQQQAARLKRGDLVEVHGLRNSSGLNGQIVTVIEPKRTRVLVEVPDTAPRHAGTRVTIPASCLTETEFA